MGRGTPVRGPLFLWLDAQKGVPGDLYSGWGDPSNFQSCCSPLIGKTQRKGSYRNHVIPWRDTKQSPKTERCQCRQVMCWLLGQS